MIALTNLIAQDTGEAECDFDQPSLTQDYWPVLSQDPMKTEYKRPPAIDVFISREGKPIRFALLGDTYAADKDILSLAAESLMFKPAYACGEPVDGFYRHLVRTYFYVDAGDMKNIDALPVALFSMPRKALEPLLMLSYHTKNRIFDVTFELSTEGIVSKVKGKTNTDKVVTTKFLSKLLPKLDFKPAMNNGEPVAVKMHFKIDMGMRYAPVYLDDAILKKPMPVRTSENDFPENKTYAVLLDFYRNGAVSNIQFLTLMNREESLATLNAFRSWKVDAFKEKDFSLARMKVQFGFTHDSDEAVLIKEDIGRFTKAPRPVKQPAPVYPDHLRKAGLMGTVVVEMIVDKKGAVRNAKVISSAHPDFSQSTLAVLKRWKFKPGEVDGNPVSTRIRMPIPFKIRSR